MKKELDEKLVKKYPKIFANRYADMRTTCMCWGFEHDDGWYWLIDNLCNSIQSYIDNNSKKERIKNKYVRYVIDYSRKIRYKFLFKRGYFFEFIRNEILNLNEFLEKHFEKETYESIPQVIATQVKEKFGALRFYYEGGNDVIDGMVWLAEHQSYNICEECGSTKNIGRTKGWITTLCEDCSKTDKNKTKQWSNFNS